MAIESTPNEIFDDEDFRLQTERAAKMFEFNRRVRAAIAEVIRKAAPYFTEEQVQGSVSIMWLTRAMPEAVDVEAIERAVKAE